jgi:SpoVK/Ycf46/Vps4 family AAA+-type ATPase
VLEEVPDVSYDDVGGLDEQIEMIKDAVELPYLYGDLFREHELQPPKGILLYGPPGCGKTLIAKAVANSLAKRVAERTDSKARSYFLNIKGPELLNKYVGETERQIRLIFQRAREKSEEGYPVIVFFDEMDSLFRTRGTGISSDIESTIVPQLLAEIGRRESQERHRDRRFEPRGPHRPRDPAARPPRREDQDRTTGRRQREGDLHAVPHEQPAALGNRVEGRRRRPRRSDPPHDRPGRRPHVRDG